MIHFNVGDTFISVRKDEYDFLHQAVITKIVGHRIEYKKPYSKRDPELDWCDRGAMTEIIEKKKEVKLISGKITNWRQRIK